MSMSRHWVTSSVTPYCLRQSLPLVLGLSNSFRLVGQWTLGSTHLCLPSTGKLQAVPPCFYVSAWELNLGPHACLCNKHFPTETSFSHVNFL